MKTSTNYFSDILNKNLVARQFSFRSIYCLLFKLNIISSGCGLFVRSIILLTILSNISLAKSACDIYDPWPETGIGLVEFKIQLSSKNCTRDARMFAACVFAIQNFSLYSRNPSQVGFFSKNDMEVRKEEIKDHLKKYGNYSLVELKPSDGARNLFTGNLNPYAYLFPKDQKVSPEEYYRTRNQTILSDLKQIIDSVSQVDEYDQFSLNTLHEDLQINFSEVIDEIGARIPKERIPMAVADSINQYFKVRADAHSRLIAGSEEKLGRLRTEQSLVGIGIEYVADDQDDLGELSLGGKSQKIQILSFHYSADGFSPAATAGLKVGDTILAIDGTDVRHKQRCEVMDLIRGQEGQPVKVTVERPGVGKKTFKVIRKKFITDNIQTKKIEYQGEDFIYLKIDSFLEQGLFRRVSEKLAQFEQNQVKGVILDLRGNKGGQLPESILIASLFIGLDKPAIGTLDLNREGEHGAKQITYLSGRSLIQDKLDRIKEVKARLKKFPALEMNLQEMALLHEKEQELAELTKYTSVTFFADKPVVVLIDGGSASGSEMVAGALRDHGVALTIGEATFGKGSVQKKEPVPWTHNKPKVGEEGSAPLYFAKTQQVFYQPSGTTNQRVGIAADFEVPIRPDMKPGEGWKPREIDREPLALTAPTLGRLPSPLQKEMAMVRDCINEDFVKSNFLQKLENRSAHHEIDYRLDYAKEVLRCFAIVKK